jgi:anthranilate synthase component 1
MQAPFDIPADLDTPVSAYLKLRHLRPRFLLESVDGAERQGRYSFLGFGKAKEVLLSPSSCSVFGQQAHVPENRSECRALLRGALAAAPVLEPEIPELAFTGGLFGVTGYPFAHRLERVRRRDAPDEESGGPGADAPEVRYLAPDAVLVFDHRKRACALLSSAPDGERQALRREVLKALRGPTPEPHGSSRFTPPAASLGRDRFVERVADVKEAIASGEVYQLVLSSAFAGTTDLPPLEAYRALRLLNPSPYMYLFEFDGQAIVGASPEALVRLEAGHAALQPIAGTRPRGADKEEDLRMADELCADPKEAAEHVMLVDLARNDLGRVARPHTIAVEPYREIQRYSHVMHLVSGVTGMLEEGFDMFDLFASCFPAGTVVGAPKIRALELIDEFEPQSRGFYAGTVGYFGHGGVMDQAICIRTLFFENGGYRFQAGAGIVADSRPEAEYDEVLNKGGAMRAALELAAEGL